MCQLLRLDLPDPLPLLLPCRTAGTRGGQQSAAAPHHRRIHPLPRLGESMLLLHLAVSFAIEQPVLPKLCCPTLLRMPPPCLLLHLVRQFHVCHLPVRRSTPALPCALASSLIYRPMPAPPPVLFSPAGAARAHSDGAVRGGPQPHRAALLAPAKPGADGRCATCLAAACVACIVGCWQAGSAGCASPCYAHPAGPRSIRLPAPHLSTRPFTPFATQSGTGRGLAQAQSSCSCRWRHRTPLTSYGRYGALLSCTAKTTQYTWPPCCWRRTSSCR